MVSPAPMLTDATIAAGPNTASRPSAFFADQGCVNTPLGGGTLTLPISMPSLGVTAEADALSLCRPLPSQLLR